MQTPSLQRVRRSFSKKRELGVPGSRSETDKWQLCRSGIEAGEEIGGGEDGGAAGEEFFDEVQEAVTLLRTKLLRRTGE